MFVRYVDGGTCEMCGQRGRFAPYPIEGVDTWLCAGCEPRESETETVIRVVVLRPGRVPVALFVHDRPDVFARIAGGPIAHFERVHEPGVRDGALVVLCRETQVDLPFTRRVDGVDLHGPLVALGVDPRGLSTEEANALVFAWSPSGGRA